MKKTVFIFLIAVVLVAASCTKKKAQSAPVDPRVPPQLDLKTGPTYVYKDTTVMRQDTLLLGFIATKTEDNLTSINGSVSYDGSTTTSSFYIHHTTISEYTGYSADVTYYVRNQAGTEKITFSVVDRDGNITKKTFTLTVL
ncbi:MAG: hypothetical protein ACXVPN_05300 [Bacteroidia bacterium]